MILGRLAAHISEESNWDLKLPAAVFAINTDVQASTQTSPVEVFFGIPTVLHVDARLPRTADEWTEVLDHIAKAQTDQKRFYDRSRFNTPDFQEGDLVLARRVASALQQLDRRKEGNS